MGWSYVTSERSVLSGSLRTEWGLDVKKLVD